MPGKTFENSTESGAGQQHPETIVDVLLATFNSGKYLSQTIKSILHQDFAHWRLWISDGGSKDNTLEIVKDYTQRHPEKIAFVSSKRRLYTCENFSGLLERSSAPYVMFCDHDDVWLCDKISKSLARMKKHESEQSRDVPVLLFTDMKVVDHDLTEICKSYFSYQNLNTKNINLRNLLVQNIPSGCTIMMNRTLVEMCHPIPSRAVMHDHWVSLIAAAFGHIVCLNEPTILYRQHCQNYFGAYEYGWKYFRHRFSGGLSLVYRRFYQNVQQAHIFLEHFQCQLSKEDAELLHDFSHLQSYSWMKRRWILLRHKIFKTGIRRNIGMLLIV